MLCMGSPLSPKPSIFAFFFFYKLSGKLWVVTTMVRNPKGASTPGFFGPKYNNLHGSRQLEPV